MPPNGSHLLMAVVNKRTTARHRSSRSQRRSSWSALTRQCLDRRIDDLTILNTELAAWQQATNTAHRQVNWQFTTADARIKLRHLYPQQLPADARALRTYRGGGGGGRVSVLR